MDKKLILGLFALLFITSGVQSFAISKIQANKAAKNSPVVFTTSINQQAAVGGVYSNTPSPDPSAPTPSAWWPYTNSSGVTRCAYMVGEFVFIGGEITNWNSSDAGAISGSNGCDRAHQGLGGTMVDVTIEYPSIDLNDKTLVISGSSVPVMQFKLFLLGYLEMDQITGKLDAATKSAVMTLQKNRGLPQTGALDSKTAASLNLVLFAFKSSSVLMNGPVSFVSKNINQKAAVGSYSDTTTSPDSPTPQGYITYIGANGGIYCMYMRYGSLHIGGQISGDGPSDTLNSWAGCNGASVPGTNTAPIDLDITFPSTDSKDKTVTVSGSSVPVMQFKLALLGYMNVEQISGKLDEVTKSAILDFQTNRGLPEVGTYGPKTQTALDLVISGVKRFSALTGGSFIFK